MSIWENIFDNLKSDGFDVYSPSTKSGECLSEYIVLKIGTGSQHPLASTDVDNYSIMCYVPKNKYSTLEPMVQKVKASMKKLYPLVIPNGVRSTSYYDDAIKAHTVTIEYKNYKKMF